MENVRKRVDVKLLRSDEEEKILKLVAKKTFVRQEIFLSTWLPFKIGRSECY